MNIINPNVDGLGKMILPVDDSIITQLVHLAFQCKKKTEAFELRDIMYKSKYDAKYLEIKEVELEKYLLQIASPDIRFSNQNQEYKWVKMNTKEMGDIQFRYYIAPNPSNMHELVRRLVDVFSLHKVPVRFKYQLTTNMMACDRLIIYSDGYHNEQIIEAIKEVYKSDPELFYGCERSMAWLYGTEVPGVYFAPETPGFAYSEVLAATVLEAKEIFNYMYGLTDKNNQLSLQGEEAKRAYELMEMIVSSLLLKKGLLLSKDLTSIVFKDKNIITGYDYQTGILKISNFDNRGYYEVKYLPTLEGREALLGNFYKVSSMQPQQGVETRYLTVEERLLERDRYLHPYKYKESNEISSGVPGKK